MRSVRFDFTVYGFLLLVYSFGAFSFSWCFFDKALITFGVAVE